MKVRATRPGFYDTYREAGHEFHIAKPEDFSDQWMQSVIEEAPVAEPIAAVEPE